LPLSSKFLYISKEALAGEIVNLSTMEECVHYAHNISKSGDNVVLSPASASFDH
jgi:UDP-N-acetylmuramoylalanine-D-glutamate ligase